MGKTHVAIQLAQKYTASIISADSRQIYTELRIGVGRPTPEELDVTPHYLIGHTSIHTPYSAGIFVKEVTTLLQSLFQEYDIIIMTGGSGLYVKAFLEGLDDIPHVPDSYKDKWTTLWKEKGLPALLTSLRQLDPVYLEQVDQANPMRLIRALAVSEATGQPFSSFRKGVVTPRDFNVLPFVLELPRDVLYARINQRVLDMLQDGWLEEARTLLPYKHLKALQTVGYKELFEHLEGKMTLETAIQTIQQSTRRYAKRQMTWWRHQGAWQHFSPDQVEEMVKAIEGLRS